MTKNDADATSSARQ